MNHDQISEGADYAGKRGKTRRVVSLAPVEAWHTPRLMRNRDCTYTIGDRTRTIRLEAFAAWALCEVTPDYPGSNGRCVADKLSVAIGAVAPCDCGKCEVTNQ